MTSTKLLLLLLFFTVTRAADLPGEWELLVADAGISSMHTAVTRFNTVVLLDRTPQWPITGTTPAQKLLPAHPGMYHSTANLLPDGRILIAGSNPHRIYKFDTEFPTELRIEAFSPEYLSPDKVNVRPVLVELPERIKYGEVFEVVAAVELPVVGVVEINFASAPFATHSFSQGQRLVKLSAETPAVEGGGMYRIKCIAPPNGKVAPPGYYMAFAVNLGVPSVAKRIQLLS
ncbi:galactose oxidase [Dorcoceras hygrometricum]|uniref:Galactose oxidase n=1 Tax=Dorcoceras hygrometricum TaxID=472368 RepID=A0A2Z7AP46_9LAMI|nr:galactose oxidase [Dorcoceras hygrometricum]